ncbi:hypothetical protein HYS49_01645 [Candidatus Woesearchaeota archaeon]|nr:hypothetical protein [Candidatus Woesearchaeota archaeon]
MALPKKLLPFAIPAALFPACFGDDYPIHHSVPISECYQASLSEKCFDAEWEIAEGSGQASLSYYRPFGIQVSDMQLRTRQPIEYHRGETLDVVVFWDTTIPRTTELAIRLLSPEIAFWQQVYAWDSLPPHGPVISVSDTLLEENPAECWSGVALDMDVCRSSTFLLGNALRDSFQYTQFHFFTDEGQPSVQFTYNNESANPTRLQLPETTSFSLELDCRDNTLPEEQCSFYAVIIEREETEE